MTSDGQSIERLREYLRTLKPEARSLLVQELERGLLRGEDSAGSELDIAGIAPAPSARTRSQCRGSAMLRGCSSCRQSRSSIDGRADHKRIGRLARVSLEPIWAWIGRDLMSAEAKALSEDINRALLADDRPKADQLVSALHDRAVQRMRDAVATIDGDEKTRRRSSPFKSVRRGRWKTSIR